MPKLITYTDGEATVVDDRTLAEAKAEKMAELAARSAIEKARGVNVTIGGNTVLIATSHQAQQELRETVNYLTANGGTQKGVTRSGAPVQFTLAIAEACLEAVNNHHSAMNAVEYDHAAAIAALTDNDDVDEYDIGTDWT